MTYVVAYYTHCRNQKVQLLCLFQKCCKYFWKGLVGNIYSRLYIQQSRENNLIPYILIHKDGKNALSDTLY